VVKHAIRLFAQTVKLLTIVSKIFILYHYK